MDDRTAALEAAHRHATQYLDSLEKRPVWPRATYDDMLHALGGELPEQPTDPVAVIDELAAAADAGLAGMAGPRFFGFVTGGDLPAALAADWLTSAWDQHGSFATSAPAAAAAETVAGQWLLDLLGLPNDSAVGFVTGAMMSNFTCLGAARRQVLQQSGCDLEAVGLRGAPPVTVIVGLSRHSSIDRAIRFLGIGTDDVRYAEVDDQGRMVPGLLSELLTQVNEPLIVSLQAGEVHTGAFDPFAELIDVVREMHPGAWIHVDGAFGLWAGASQATRHLVAGVEGADSWTTDAHKTLNVPYDCGLAIVRDPAALRAAFGVSADYLVFGTGDPYERTPELSRRARGFPVYAALRSLGHSGVEQLINALCANAQRMAEGLLAVPDLSILNDVVFTQLVLRVGDSDELTQHLGAELLRDGTSAFTPGRLGGKAVVRCSMSNWSTTPDDIDESVAAVARCLEAVRSAG